LSTDKFISQLQRDWQCSCTSLYYPAALEHLFC